MTQRKLTLSIDDKLIEKAKAVSKARGTSLSQLVSRYLDSLPPETGRQTPVVRRLMGVLPEDASVAEYHRYLHEKHRV